ncbi:hypothetical protein LIR38_24430, partial [Shigella sonnei]
LFTSFSGSLVSRIPGAVQGYRLAELVLMHEPLARMRWCG